MKKTSFLLLSCLSTLPFIAHANPGAYIQGEAGLAAVSPVHEDVFTTMFTSSAGVGLRLSGGYLLGDNNFNYGVESGLFFGPKLTSTVSFFGPDEEDVTYSVVNADILGVLKYTFNNGIALFSKGGLAFTHQSFNVKSSIHYEGDNIPIGEANASGSKIAPEIAVGLGYQFNPHYEIDLTANTVFAGTANSDNPAALQSSLMLGLTYHFA